MVAPFRAMSLIISVIFCAVGGSCVAQDLSADKPKLTTATFGDWVLVCSESHGMKNCEVDQNVADKQGRPLMRLRVGPVNDSSKSPVVIAQFPVNVSTGHPIVWSVNNVAVEMGLRACFQASCFADAKMPQEILRQLKHAPVDAKVEFRISQANGSEIAVPLSFKGFVEAWDSAGLR